MELVALVAADRNGLTLIQSWRTRYSGVARRGQRVLQHPPLASESAPQVLVTN